MPKNQEKKQKTNKMLLSKKQEGRTCFENTKVQKVNQNAKKVKESEKDTTKGAKKCKIQKENKMDEKSRSKMESVMIFIRNITSSACMS